MKITTVRTRAAVLEEVELAQYEGTFRKYT